MGSFYLSELIGMPMTELFAMAAKKRKEEKGAGSLTEFFNGLVTTQLETEEFFISLGIPKLIEDSLVVKINEDNLLTITWQESRKTGNSFDGFGLFKSQIPKEFSAQRILLSYKEGVLEVRVPVCEKNNAVLFAKLV